MLAPAGHLLARGKLRSSAFVAAAFAACAFCGSAQARVPIEPTVAALSPASGSIAGGTKVTITGANFVEVQGVSFGDTPAVSFKVDSESQITAVAPASGTLGETTVTVTTVAGSAIGFFTYRGCQVPQLRGLGLTAAKRLLRKADCGVGKVTTLRGKAAKRQRVVRQSPRPATVLAPGAKVSLTLR